MKAHLYTAPFAIVAILLISACGNSERDDARYQEQPRIVKTQTLTKFDGYLERHITGKLQAADTTSLAFEVSGVVKKVYINLGEAFSKGDLLAELDPQLYNLTVNQRSSAIAETKASRVEAKQNHDRNLSLKQQNLISQAVVDNSQAAYDIANERVNSATSALQIAKKNLSDTKLYAPYDGTVSKRLIEPSMQVSPQVSAFTIQGNANLEVSATVPESLIGRIELGEDVKVQIPALASKQQYSASLTEIGSQASIANAFPITITFTQAYPRLLPGMSAEIRLPIRDFVGQSPQMSSEDELVLFEIPLSAIASDEKGQYVQVIQTIKETQKAEDNKETEKSEKSEINDITYIVQKHYIDILQTLPKSILAKIDFDTDKDIEVVTAGVAFITDQQRVTPLNKIQQIYNP